jgi:hypothetical protein
MKDDVMVTNGGHAEERDELSERLAARELRQKARAVQLRQAKIEGLKLEEKYEAELGPVGVEFQMVDASELGEGFVVLRRGEEVLWKRYMASKKSATDTHELVMPCVVHPTKEKFLELIGRRAHIEERCAFAIGTLHGVKMKEEEGKF